MGLESWLKIELYRWEKDVILVLAKGDYIRDSVFKNSTDHLQNLLAARSSKLSASLCDFFFVTNF